MEISGYQFCFFFLAAQLTLAQATEVDNPPLQPAGSDQASWCDSLAAYGCTLAGAAYAYGATGPGSFDCSGFTCCLFRRFGVDLPHGSRAQSLLGEEVAVDSLRPGDLLFFTGRNAARRQVGHVAVVTGIADGMVHMVHASVSRGVVVEAFTGSGYYECHFLGARRIPVTGPQPARVP